MPTIAKVEIDEFLLYYLIDHYFRIEKKKEEKAPNLKNYSTVRLITKRCDYTLHKTYVQFQNEQTKTVRENIFLSMKYSEALFFGHSLLCKRVAYAIIWQGFFCIRLEGVATPPP